MAVPFGRFAFTLGEVAPDLFGRADLARYMVACSTARNFYVGYQGGLYSRAGTMFVGYSKQTGRSYPPRLLPFQFNLNQGLVLEFGHEYMRVIENGAFVTETAIDISDITNADPGVVTIAAVNGATAASPNNAGVTVSYAPGELITLAGGTFASPAVLEVTETFLKSLALNAAGTGYDVSDTITLTGGTQTTPAELTVATVQVVSATISNPGAGGADGPAVVEGTTGTGTKFQANVTIVGGVIDTIDSIETGGSYTVAPTTPDPVTPVSGGAGLAGAELDVVLGVNTFTISNDGVFTANPSGFTFTQNTTSGTGVGATFRFALMAIETLAIDESGVYTSTPGNPVSQASTSGSGTGATYTMTFGSTSPYQTGDWLFLSGVGGMSQVNGQTYVIEVLTATTFELKDVFGNDVDTSTFGTYTSGGTAARIYTMDTPYREEDLSYLKWAQSEDVVSLCLVNQMTDVEYEPQDLERLANNDWQLVPLQTGATVEAPENLAAVSSSGSSFLNYAYTVTAVDPDNASESVAADAVELVGVNLSSQAGTIRISWEPVQDVKQYNVYKATPSFLGFPPVGSLFGFIGTSYGAEFIDNNIISDFAQVPPLHANPFARGQLIGAMPVSGGSGYTTVDFTITSSGGTGAILRGVIVSGSLNSIIVVNPGQGYADGDTVAVTGDGSGATAVLSVGPQEGTYPGVVSYFQQRRVYANTLNRPNTYFMSQPAAFTNFDQRIPTIDTDAIIGNPWSAQMNGIQSLVQMPGGLVALTGEAAWQLTGAGGSSFNPQPITPSSQDAQQQAFNGCHDHLPPIQIDGEFLFVQAKGSIIRSMGYQYFQNIYTGADTTLNSSHLFTGFQIVDWTWCEEPYKVVWTVRDDGTLLALTYVKPQEVMGWTRNDTNGLFRAVCAVTEVQATVHSPQGNRVDALYAAVERFPEAGTCYMIERMDSRIWNDVEEAWCVDAAIAARPDQPAATLTVDSATGLGAIASYTVAAGGENYSAATTAEVIDQDPASQASGATISLTIAGGVITAATGGGGTGYIRPKITITDPTNAGSGGEIVSVLDNTAEFTSDPGVFGSTQVGDVIRVGGGIAEVTSLTSATVVEANIVQPIVEVVPNTNVPLAAPEGQWTLGTPSSSFFGAPHLAGYEVTGLYDGKVFTTTVDDTGAFETPEPATMVVVGLAYLPQFQTIYLDPQMGPTQQGQRKSFPELTVRLKTTRGLQTGTNQPDGSTFSPMQIGPVWANMKDVPDLAVPPYGSDVQPLYTGDVTISPSGGWNERGQVAFQQPDPLPATILAIMPAELPGDVPEQGDWKPPRRG